MTTELKPCPFCGGQAEMNVRGGNYGYTPDIYYVRCKRCGAKIEIISNNYKNLSKSVINAWNKRVNLETYTQNTDIVGMISEGW